MLTYFECPDSGYLKLYAQPFAKGSPSDKLFTSQAVSLRLGIAVSYSLRQPQKVDLSNCLLCD